MIPQYLRDGSKNPEWLAARAGKISASNLSRIMGSDTVRITYLSELLAERLGGASVDHYVSQAMQNGAIGEAATIMRYETEIVGEFGSVAQAGWEETDYGLGATPDGFVGNAGMVEVKRPYWKTVCKERWGPEIVGKEPAVNKDYWWQCQGQMAVTGRQWCDLVYEPQDIDQFPHLPAHLTLWVRRIERDDKAIEKAKEAVIQCNDVLRSIERAAIIPPRSKAVSAIVSALNNAQSHSEIDDIMRRAEAAMITDAGDRRIIEDACHKRTVELPTVMGA